VTPDKSLVSVIIPVFNREAFLAEAVESALGQAGASLEVIVVDDGSTDGTARVAAQFADRIRYVFQENAGPPAARNRGVSLAGGEFLAFLDSDDLWPPGRTGILLDWLNAHPATGVAMGHMKYIPVETSRSPQCAKALAETPSVLNYNLSAALIRVSAMRAVRSFDETLRYSDDWDWFVRAREQGIGIDILPDVTLINRRHRENLSNQRAVGDHYTLQMLKKSLDRRRAEKK
jgi:glycosyltransferase involved in cell wall biosynthesis